MNAGIYINKKVVRYGLSLHDLVKNWIIISKEKCPICFCDLSEVLYPKLLEINLK